ncbi:MULTISPECIES: hypothetical protein [Haloferax]|uniref:Uncharacterized protein n=1 Tax=Haloferax marinum TaxID=2666143 RepID=A0A6A8G6J9_9EURY|nr:MULTISPECIES: hypothetical protein [Haloferax]KAB1197149.1 hypothetical protein Hfx1150_06300 [Haloferax sp. CBA1150]MRW96182.1 hypothetical protein [Haloferax marinum]
MSTAPDLPADERPPLTEQASVRLHLVGTALVAGVAVVTVALVGATLLGDLTAAIDTAFALGSLVFGFGLLGWSSAVALGRGIEAMQEHLDTHTGWTEPDARRAMARILGFGLGVMAGATLVGSFVYGSVL